MVHMESPKVNHREDQARGAEGQVHLDGHGNDKSMGEREIEKIPIAQSCDKRGSKGRAV